jgi:flagellar hook-basal body complex protein FliE
MIVDPIAVVPTALAGLNPSQPTGEAGGVGFSDWLGQHLASANTQLVQADDGVRKLALGEADNLHQVMINLEKAKLSFELVVQVRNKLLDAYQELMRMQI